METQGAVPVEFDEDGLLKDPNAWSEALAQEIARENGIAALTDEHWEVIRTLREHYAKFGVAPAMYHVCRSHGKGPSGCTTCSTPASTRGGSPGSRIRARRRRPI